ncbi:MAG TPA: hypothetical protein VFX20_18080 [Steroidobacteraceae bacterium]|nr:hypothetical protein [Steroidobacteraceae bacterium]
MGFNEDTAYLGPMFTVLQGAGQGAAKGEALLAGVGHAFNALGVKAVGNVPVLGSLMKYEEERSGALEQDAAERVKALTPDPTTTGAATRILSGLVSGAYRVSTGSLVGGPLAGAGLLGASEALGRYQQLTDGQTKPLDGARSDLSDLQAVPGSQDTNPSTWDKRADGSTKGNGWLGLLRRPDGGVSSELSVGVGIDGKETEIPLIVPGLSRSQVEQLLAAKPSQAAKVPGVLDQAVAFARRRIAAGKSPFAGSSESPQYDFGPRVGTGAALASAAVTGVTAAAGALIPGGFGASLFSKIATGAAANVGLGLTNRYADHKILEAAGYKDMADQARVWDGVGMFTDALLGGAFGGLAHLHAAAEAGRSKDGAPSALDQPGVRDAALTANLAMRDRAGAPGAPVDPASAATHQEALETAIGQLSRNEPVNVADIDGRDAAFVQRPAQETSDVQELFTNALKEGGVLEEQHSVDLLERALNARLTGEKPEAVQTPAPGAFEPRRPEETDQEFAARLKAYAKANIDTGPMPDMGQMAKDWQPYFAHGGDAVVPLGELDFGAKPQEGREQMGVKRMAAAANGQIPKREPLQVALGADGRLRVIDGKSTLGALRQVGVTHAPVELVHGTGTAGEELGKLKPEAGRKLARMYVGANEALPQFRVSLEQLAQETGTRVRIAPLKGLGRAVEKAQLDYVGDPSKLKDLVRGAIEVDSEAEARAVLDGIEQHFEVLSRGRRNLLDLNAPEPLDGYRDAKLNVRLENGTIAEIQVHVPEMLAAKEEGGGHKLYQLRRLLDEKKTELTPEEQKRFDELNAQMRAIYGPLWDSFMRRSKSAGETSAPLRSVEPSVNGRGSGVSNARAVEPPSGVGSQATGTPSTSNSLVPGANERTGLTGERRDLPAIVSPPASSIPRAAHTVMTATGRRIEVAPKVVELGDLITSDHPEYPQELQPRQRGARAALTEQVRGIARNLNPDLLGNAPEADRGAPITGPGNVVESGNGRAFALREVYANHPEKAAEYRDYLKRLGYDTEGMKEPVLVRHRLTPLEGAERRAFTVEANQTSVAALSPVERAQADARLLDASVLSQLKSGELHQAQNAPLVRSFLERLPEAERNELVNPDGTVSQAGVRRLQAAILAKAYGGAAESNAVLGRMLESTDNDMRSTMGALIDAAPAFAKLRQAIEDGKIGPEYDLSKALTQAVETVAQVREKGQALGEFLKQEDMLTRRPPVVDALMKALYDKKGERIAARDKVARTLMNYADRALKQRLDQGMLFGDAAVPPERLLTSDENTAESPTAQPKPGSDLFGLRTPQGATRESVATEIAHGVLEQKPNIEIVGEDGSTERARAELMGAEAAVQTAEERAPDALSIAANCFGQRAA